MQIIKILTREEIIDYELRLTESRVARFISLYKLTPVEKDLFYKRFNNREIRDFIDYYQNKDKTAFERTRNMI